MKVAAAMVFLCVTAAARAAEPPSRVEATLQFGTVLENPAFGPQIVFGRRVASWRRLDVFLGTTQVYRLTPALGDPVEFGAGTSRMEYRHHWSSLFGPGARLRLPPADRLTVGADLLGGFAYLGIHGRFKNPAQGIDRDYSASDIRGLYGTRLWISFQVGLRWSIAASYWQPLHVVPTSGWHAGLGAARAF